MKIKKGLILGWISLIFALAAIAWGGENTSIASPAVFVPEPFYEFDPVAEGSEVRHDYVIRNNGKDTLEIQKVKTG